MKKGFTLIELLVVIAIIGILSAVVLAAFTEAKQEATLSPDEYCETLSDRHADQLPAKCLKYFGVKTINN